MIIMVWGMTVGRHGTRAIAESSHVICKQKGEEERGRKGEREERGEILEVELTQEIWTRGHSKYFRASSR